MTRGPEGRTAGKTPAAIRLRLLHRPRVQPDGTMRLERLASNELDEALEIIRQLVGYAPR